MIKSSYCLEERRLPVSLPGGYYATDVVAEKVVHIYDATSTMRGVLYWCDCQFPRDTDLGTMFSAELTESLDIVHDYMFYVTAMSMQVFVD